MPSEKRKFLFFVTKPYSFSILDPIEEYINKNNIGEVAWFTASTAASYKPSGKLLITEDEVMSFNPNAILAPGNIVPSNWPGIKVQIFHGIDDEVKGFYSISGQFDLYCTSGPEMTKQFEELSKQYNTFKVVETGWPKLDPLFESLNNIKTKEKVISKLDIDSTKPIILYAPTFPPKYSSASELYEEISKLTNEYQLIIKFHTLMDKDIQSQYNKIASDSVKIIDDNDIIPLLLISDILITDTSSVAYEFLPLDRPIITYRAIARKDKGVDIVDSKDLHGAIVRSLIDPLEYSENRQFYLNNIHPYSDGNSSARVVQAIEDFIQLNKITELSTKPKNYIKNYKIKKMLLAIQ